MPDLSILIPARNEQFLARTIRDIFEHAEGDTEVIAVLDGQWAEPPVPDHERLTLIYHPESIGQRAATNEAARLSNAKYLMKLDAHCAFDQGFDVKLMADMQPDWTMVPVMRNLHAFDWVCKNGHRRYQSPSGPCRECGEPTTQDVVWIGKHNPQSTSYRFDKTMHFQYFDEWKKQQKGDLIETMSLQGSCFMLTRNKYFELDICDERHGSWGQQGTEVACKTWLSGGRCIVSRKTWYAHMFRTQGGDFGFPYPNPGIARAQKYSRDLWLNNKWDKAIHPLSWLVDKFAPVPGWE
jgi:glycosyltransferase involved in cell wall biosynthesis